MANPNPSPATRFKPGQSGNPSGKSAEQVAREAKTSEIASIVTHMGLSKLQEKLENGEIDPVDILTGDILRFIKEAQDRAHGTPKQSVDHSSGDGSMSPKPALDATKLSPQAMAEILNAATDEG